MNRTKIQWAEFTANPVRYRNADGLDVWACSKVSPGCTNCYAEELALNPRMVSKGRALGNKFNDAEMAKLTPYLDEGELRKMLTFRPRGPFKNPSGRPSVFVGDMPRGQGLSWWITGGESGTKARPFDLAWARSAVRTGRETGLPVFVKQLGRRPFVTDTQAKAAPLGVRRDYTLEPFRVDYRLRDAHGGDMAEWPEDLRRREFPKAVAS